MKKYPLLFLALLSLAACRHRRDEPHTAASLPKIEVCRAQSENVSRRMRFQSRLGSNYNVTIQPRVNGYLLSKNFRKGLPVKKGQLLYTIDPSQLNLTVASARASLASAKVQLMEAENNYRRAVPLAKIDAISQSSLDQYQAAYAAAQAQVRSAESVLRNAEIELGYATIYSPADGIIDDTGASVGDYVGPGTDYSSLATISNTEIVSASIAIPFSKYLAVKENSEDTVPSYDNSHLLSDITLYLSDGTEYPRKGRYSYTKKDAGDQTGTILIVVVFPNPDRVLKIGQSAMITADVGAPAGAVLVPQRAVTQSQGSASVWLMKPDSTVCYTSVTLGNTFGDLWIIDKGVEAGDMVVLSGAKMRNGIKIDPIMTE